MFWLSKVALLWAVTLLNNGMYSCINNKSVWNQLCFSIKMFYSECNGEELPNSEMKWTMRQASLKNTYEKKTQHMEVEKTTWQREGKNHKLNTHWF